MLYICLMEMKLLYTGIDNINGKNYQVYSVNAVSLSNYLRDLYTSLGYNISDYDTNTSNKANDNGEVNEIYEYLNFSLLKRKDDYILLDGFRRMLIYNPPNFDVNVRVYDIEDLNDKELLSILTYYNHYKTVGTSGGQYFARGFALLIDIIFDVNIMDDKLNSLFQGYLERVYNLDSLSWGRNNMNGTGSLDKTIKERIVSDNFINDLKFMRDAETNMDNRNSFGAMLYDLRKEGHTDLFDVKLFNEECLKSDSIQEQIKKYKKPRGAEQETVSFVELIKMYKAILLKQLNIESEKTYAEKLTEITEIYETLNKDKNLLKITGFSKWREFTAYVSKLSSEKVEFRFKTVVFPKQPSRWGGMQEPLPYGVYDSGYTLKISNIGNYQKINVLDINLNGKHIKNGGWSSYGGIPTRFWVEIAGAKCYVFFSVEGKTKKDILKEL